MPRMEAASFGRVDVKISITSIYFALEERCLDISILTHTFVCSTKNHHTLRSVRALLAAGEGGGDPTELIRPTRHKELLHVDSHHAKLAGMNGVRKIGTV